MSALGGRKAGFVSTRLSGTDGVSLETGKWAATLERLGLRCYYFAGQVDRPETVSRTVPEAFFRHPDIDEINGIVFGSNGSNGSNGSGGSKGSNGSGGSTGSGDRASSLSGPVEEQIVRRDFFSPYVRPPHVARRIDEIRSHLRTELYGFIRDFDLDMLVVENALAIPLNIPLALALTDVIAETGIPAIAHHHDLAWERQRFAVNSVPDLISAAFPPPLPSVHHVVINSVQAQQLAWRRGLNSRVIPNVMDYDREPAPPDEYALHARADLGIEDGEAFILQPTRIIQRKGIEHAIELVRRLGLPAKLVVSHAGGEEGDDYERRVKEFAHLLDVPVRFESEVVGECRCSTPDGRRCYALADIYPQADLVTYGSSLEGFGNAFLEAVYYRRPLVVNRYSVYEIDIAPKGFRVVEFDNYISEATVRAARELIEDPRRAADWAEINYELARRHFSFRVLERRLGSLVAQCLGEER
jgi:glycosyltransferase involved in cell wall biosynthesis